MHPLIRPFLAALIFAAATAAPAVAAPAAAGSSPDTITFEQYRDWRLHFIEQRQIQIAAEQAQKDLPAARRASLERQKAYYEYFAAMDPAGRDRLFRQRFDQIDANHDGIVDAAERAAWHDKQRAFYDRRATRRQASAETDHRR